MRRTRAGEGLRAAGNGRGRRRPCGPGAHPQQLPERPASRAPWPRRSAPAATRGPADGRPPGRPAPARTACCTGCGWPPVAASALVLVLTGTAWGLYRDVTGGITTTERHHAGSSGGGAEHPARRRRQPHRRAGQPAAAGGAAAAAQRAATPACSTPTRSSCCTCPRAAGRPSAFSIPRDSYVDIPGYRRDKINAAYPAMKALTAERLVAEGVRDPARIDAESAEAGRTRADRDRGGPHRRARRPLRRDQPARLLQPDQAPSAASTSA